MPASDDAPFCLLDDDGRIAVSLDCAKCGYDLRGRRMDECCTECGREVQLSTEFAELRIGAPKLTKQLRRDARVIQFGALISVLAPISVMGAPDLPLQCLFIAVPAASLAYTAVAVRLSLRRQAVDLGVSLLMLALTLLAIQTFTPTLSGGGSQVNREFGVFCIGYFFWAQVVALDRFASAIKNAGIDALGRRVRLREIVGQAYLLMGAVISIALVGEFLPKAVTLPTEPCLAIGMILALFQWLFSMNVYTACGRLRRELRPPPTAKWLEGRSGSF